MAERKVLAPSSETHKRFLNCTSQFIIFGGGAGCGKSHQALMKILKYIKDPNFRGVFIRQTSTQLSQAGGLFMEAQKMWRPFGAKFKSHPQMTAEFPSGAQVQFKVCGADRDINNFDGGQFSLVTFDEAQWHSDVQIKYLESRIRSEAQGPHQLVATCNPSMTSYLYQFVKPYLDLDTGIPKRELSGVERYYATFNGATVTGATAEELYEIYGPSITPQTYTFIAATIEDNPIMRKINPSYVARLENLKRTERMRLLLGSWHAKEEGAGFWKRGWCEVVTHAPANLKTVVRSWDLAASVPSEVNPNPDWTAGVKIGRDSTGTYYILDAYKFRKLSDGVLKEIIKVFRDDGDDTVVTLPKDSGQGGAVAHAYFRKILAENGVPTKTVVMSGHSGKLKRFLPFASLCEGSGNVKIVRGDWNEWYMNQLEDFTGERTDEDDAVDATSDAFNELCKNVSIPAMAVPSLIQASPIPTI